MTRNITWCPPTDGRSKLSEYCHPSGRCYNYGSIYISATACWRSLKRDSQPPHVFTSPRSLHVDETIDPPQLISADTVPADLVGTGRTDVACSQKLSGYQGYHLDYWAVVVFYRDKKFGCSLIICKVRKMMDVSQYMVVRTWTWFIDWFML